MPKYQPRSEDMTSAEKMTTKVGSLTLQYPTLSRDNYASWAIKMKVYMKAQDVWDAVEPATGVSVEDRKDQMALAAIYQGIPEETLMVIAEKQTAKEAWETLKTMHLGADRVRNAKVQTLKSEFELLRMKESDNIDDFSTKLTGVVNKIRALGGKMQDSYVVSKLLRAVPERFLTIVSTIEQFGNIDSMSLEEAIGRLKAHEERARVFRDNDDDHLLLTHAEWQASAKKNSDGNGRGRARGVGRWRGRGQAGRSGQAGRGDGQDDQVGRGGGQGSQAGRGGFGGQGGHLGGGFGHDGAARQEGESSTSGGRDKSNIKCFNCGVYGHFQSECHKQRHNHDQEAHLTRVYDDEPALMMAVSQESPTVVLLNEDKVVPDLLAAGEAQVDTDVWYLDNGASNHMTGHRGKFKELDEKITGIVKFGDGSAVEIKGKGSILFQCKNGDQRLLPEVYYIPSLKSNIISLGQMTEDGSKVVLADEFLRVFDRNGILLMRVTRSANRLYRIELKTCKPVCLTAKHLDDQIKVHETTNKRLQEYNTSLHQYNCTLQAEVATNSETISKLNEEKNSMMGTITSLRNNVTSMKTRLDNYRSLQQEAVKQKEDLKGEVDSLRSDLQLIRDDHDTQLAQVQSLVVEIANLRELTGKSATEVEKTMTKANALEETCSSQRERIQALLEQELREKRNQEREQRREGRYGDSSLAPTPSLEQEKEATATYAAGRSRRVESFQGSEAPGSKAFVRGGMIDPNEKLRSLVSEVIGSEPKPVTLFVDNKAALALMKNPVFHGRSKHIDTRFHFIRECVERGQIKVEFVCTSEQRADILTKALARVKFIKMRELLGVRDLESRPD